MEVSIHINFEISVLKPIFNNVSFLSLSTYFYETDTKYNFEMPFLDRFVNRFLCNVILNTVEYKIYIKSNLNIFRSDFFVYVE